jgi:hypothetical protein
VPPRFGPDVLCDDLDIRQRIGSMHAGGHNRREPRKETESC